MHVRVHYIPRGIHVLATVCTNRETNKHFIFEIYFICVATKVPGTFTVYCTCTELCAFNC